MIETVNESIVKIEPKIVLDGTVWGDITGIITDQTDLKNALDGKAPTGDYALVSNVPYLTENKVDKVAGKGLSANDFTDADKQQIAVNNNSIWLIKNEDLPALDNAKVDKIAGKSLSANDYTTAEKNKLAGLFLPAYASIYLDNGNTAQSIPTGATYTKVTAYTTNGQSANCTPDAANDKITITQAGVYSVTYTASYTADVNNVTFRGAVFLGGVEQGNIHSGGQMGLQGALRSTACSGFINVTSVPADIDVRIRHDNGGTVAITHVYANLNIERIG